MSLEERRVAHDVPFALERHPELLPVADGHAVRCWMYHDADGSLRPEPLDARSVAGDAT